MSHQQHPLKHYHNQELISELNFLFIRLKKYIYHKDKYPNAPPPTSEEMDHLMLKIIHELKKRLLTNENLKPYFAHLIHKVNKIHLTD